MTVQNYVNHIVLELDASGSMYSQTEALIKVADGEIKYLAQRSQELGQETRVSVYMFNSKAKCIIWDMDVLRLPSIKDLYRANGNTALIDATIMSLNDLAEIPEKYGDHAFLVYVLTDGQENGSTQQPTVLKRHLASLRDNWTVAVLVPDQRAAFEAKKFGFPADNIAIWDAASSQGVAEGGTILRRATENYMIGRSQGVRSSRSMFSTGADAVNVRTVAAAGIMPLSSHSYVLVPVDPSSPSAIREFVQGCGLPYVLGRAYYQLSKTESIQPNKLVAIVEKATSKVYLGREARDLIGLPDVEVRVRPDFNADFNIFVQSTSVNRKLVVGTKLLILQ